MASNEFLTWSAWLAANSAGSTRDPVVSVGKISGIVVRNQGGYGIVNVGLVDTDTKWTTDNTAGEEILKTVGADTEIVEIWAYVQGGYGIVDIGFQTANGADPVRFTNNDNGKETERFRLNGLRGLIGQEQGRYGIVDLRFGGKV